MTTWEIEGLRKYYSLPSGVSDQEIEAGLKGSLGLSVVRIEKSKTDLSRAFKKSLPRIITKGLGC